MRLAFSLCNHGKSRSVTRMSLYFPSKFESSTEHETTFKDACYQAIALHVPLILTENVVLNETIRLREKQILNIQASTRLTISGELHSLFLLNNKSRLFIENVNLDHTLQTDDHKEVGAAINLRCKGSIHVSNSCIVSTSGFCVWAVQKSCVHLVHCELRAVTRSAMVCFGQAECQLESCRIDRAGVHGLCARGACQIVLSNCDITNSAARALYGYANASVTLQVCRISGTLHPAKAAIEVSSMGCGEKQRSSLTIRDCHVVDNRGVGIRLQGDVDYQVDGQNFLEDNDQGNIDILENRQDDGYREGSHMDTGMLSRDESGSSFRRGDWWCVTCHKINAARRSRMKYSCSICGEDRDKCGRLLMVDEIRQCNQGIDIRESLRMNESSTTKFDNAANSIAVGVLQTIWEFDGDDEKGWILYDEESSILLEDLYQRLSSNPVSTQNESCRIRICGRKYAVDLNTMEQINIETQFLRNVRRRIIGKDVQV